MDQMEQALRKVGFGNSVDSDLDGRYWYQFYLSPVTDCIETQVDALDVDMRMIRIIREFSLQFDGNQIHKVKMHGGIDLWSIGCVYCYGFGCEECAKRKSEKTDKAVCHAVEIVFTLTEAWWKSSFTSPFNPNDIQLLYCGLKSMLHRGSNVKKELDLNLSVIRIPSTLRIQA